MISNIQFPNEVKRLKKHDACNNYYIYLWIPYTMF